MKSSDVIKKEIREYRRQLKACEFAIKNEKRYKRKLQTLVNGLCWVLEDDKE